MDTLSEVLTSSLTQVSHELLRFLPLILAAVIILTGGFVLGNWFKALITKALEFFNISKLTKNTAVSEFLEKADAKKKIEEVVGETVKWLIVMVFFIAAVNVLGLVTVSQFLNSILGYIPNVISACLVLTAGVLIGGWVESVVKGSLGVTSMATGRLMGKIAGYTVVVFTILAAISELGIAERFINTLFVGFVAMLAIGFGLAFGLGAKDIVAKILGEWYKNIKKDTK